MMCVEWPQIYISQLFVLICTVEWNAETKSVKVTQKDKKIPFRCCVWTQWLTESRFGWWLYSHRISGSHLTRRCASAAVFTAVVFNSDPENSNRVQKFGLDSNKWAKKKKTKQGSVTVFQQITRAYAAQNRALYVRFTFYFVLYRPQV